MRFEGTRRLAARVIVSALVAWLATSASQAATIDFEDLPLSPESYYSVAPGVEDGSFVSGGAKFRHSLDQWGFWSGWAYSNMTDVTTSGHLNQHSAYHLPGGGGDDSPNYAVAFGDNAVITFDGPVNVQSASITNATYAALSMLEGDGFAKKFGGDLGNEPDFFSVTIQGRVGGDQGTILGAVEFFLADYRFDDSSQDYVVSEWTDVLLNFVGIDTLTFEFVGSDVGDFGLNTPAYFALDNLVYSAAASAEVPEPSTLALGVLGGALGLLWQRRRRAARKANVG